MGTRVSLFCSSSSASSIARRPMNSSGRDTVVKAGTTSRRLEMSSNPATARSSGNRAPVLRR